MKIIFQAQHRFGPTDTIRAAIRRYNNKVLTTEELEFLTEEFIKINTKTRSHPRVGDVYLVPVIAMPETTGPIELDGIVMPDRSFVKVEDLNVSQAVESTENENTSVEETVLDVNPIPKVESAVPEEDTFPSSALVLLQRDYPHHYELLQQLWGTPNFIVYVNRIVKGAGQTGWPKENYDEMVALKDSLNS